MIFNFKTPETTIFQLWREKDFHGISGVGHVLDGTVFPDGTTVVRWRGRNKSTVVFKSFRQFEKIHMANHGKCEVRWVDGFNGIDFTQHYLQKIHTSLSDMYNTSKNDNKYMIAKLRQLIATKMIEVGELRNDKNIRITQDDRESSTGLLRTGIDTESFTRPPKSDAVLTKIQDKKI